MRKAGSAKQAAVEFLDLQFKRGTWGPGDHLPTVKELAKIANVSVNAMVDALGEFRQSGLLSIRPKKGIIVNGTEPEIPDTQITEVSWQRVKKNLSFDIHFGQFRNASKLPSIKELTFLYNVCSRTMSKALDELCDDRLINKTGHTLHINRPKTKKGKNQIAFFVPPSFAKRYSNLSTNIQVVGVERSIEFMREMERIVSAHNFKLCLIHFEHASFMKKLRAMVHNLMGIVVWEPTFLGEELPLIISKMSTFNVNIALYDNVTVRFLPKIDHFPGLFTIPFDNTSGGKIVGQFLLSYGHRRVTYFGQDIRWSRERYNGIRTMYEQAGLSDAVTFSIFTGKILEKNLAEKELRNNKSTVWVAENDDNAIFLLDFLTKKKIAVPNTISIMGFDDSLASLSYDLASYNFDIPAYAHKIFQWFLQPLLRPQNRKYRKIDTHITGYVVPRKTIRNIT